MDVPQDDKVNPEENQSRPNRDESSRPIFESVPVEPMTGEVSLRPEEVSPELSSPEEVVSPPIENMLSPEDNRKKFFLIGIGALLFLIFFVFVLRFILKSGAPKKQIILNYWGLWEDKTVLDPLIQQYQVKNKNIKIEYQKMDPRDYRDKLIVRSKRNDGPDIFRFHNTWLPEIKELVSPLPPSVMSQSEFEQTFYPIYKKDLKIDNNYYGIPLMIDGLVLIYNESLFKKAGINSPPVTWEELTADAVKLSVKDKSGQIVTAGIALGTASNVEHFSDIFGLFLVLNGGEIKNLDRLEAAQALQAYRKFAEPTNNVWDDLMPNSITAFIQEKVAMIIVPSWEVLVIKSANPDISLKVVSIPIIPGQGNKPVSLASYWVEGVSRLSRNQIEAWKFLKFLSEKENMAKLYESQSKGRLFGEPYSRVDLGDTLLQNEYTSAVIKQADAYVSLPLVSRTYDNGLNDDIIKYIENAINASTQGVDYSQALKTAQDGIVQILSRFNIK